MKHVLVVSSRGGHLRQAQALSSALQGYHVTQIIAGERCDTLVPDCNARTPLRALVALLRLAVLMARCRPDVVISTGALPGALAIMVGRVIGARTIWIDSVANAERMSLSGRCVRPFAELWLTQWPSVARATGARYAGSVL